MTEEAQSRVATLVAVLVAERTDMGKEMNYSGLLVYDMRNRCSNQSHNVSRPLISWVIAEPPAVEVMMRYEGLLLHDTGMHMIVMGPIQGKQVMDVCCDVIAMNEDDEMMHRGFGEKIFEVF